MKSKKKALEMSRLMSDFGKRLKAARITAGFGDATEYSAFLGIASPRYRKYERGEAIPPLHILRMIKDTSGSSLDWLLLGDKSSAKINQQNKL